MSWLTRMAAGGGVWLKAAVHLTISRRSCDVSDAENGGSSVSLASRAHSARAVRSRVAVSSYGWPQ